MRVEGFDEFIVRADFAPKGFVYGFGCKGSAEIYKNAPGENKNKIKKYFAGRILKLGGGAIEAVAGLAQVHSDKVVFAAELEADYYSLEADALVTSVKGLALTIQTADCLPIAFFSSAPQVAAIAHAGWRGTAGGVVERTMELINRKFAVSPSELSAVVGPCISAENYEVDDELYNRFVNSFGKSAAGVTARGTKSISLRAAVRRILLNAGVMPANIYDLPLCSHGREDLFYSHRRDDGNTARMTNFIAITEISSAGPAEEIEI